MVRGARGAAAPVYLFLCLVLGGSAQGIFANMLLQLLGLGLLAWAAISPSDTVRCGSERQLYGLILLGLALVALQLVPLPPSIWPSLGGRSALAAGYGLLGLPVPWLPLSVAPYESLATLLTIIPPLALLTAILRLGARPLWLIAALLMGLFAGILLGILQVSTQGTTQSPWYLYPDTNVGFATGFFANSNHMATLLLVSIPFLAALLAAVRHRGAGMQANVAATIILVAAALLVLLGIALNRSLAGYCLTPPVILASALLVVGPKSRFGPWIIGGAGLLFVGALGLMVFAPVGANPMQQEATASVVSRHDMLSTSMKAAEAYMPLGSGLGTFPRVYALYEDHQRLDPTRSVNHAHDDYAELVLEMGIPGVVLLILFLLWWGRDVARTWSASEPRPFAQAAAIASATILVHSLVDYPLRTAAISSCFGMCLALLIRWQPEVSPTDVRELRPTRHLVID